MRFLAEFILTKEGLGMTNIKMTTGKQLELGFRTYFNAIGFIFSKGLWWAFVVPIILNVLVFIVGFSFIGSVTKDFQDWIIGLIGIKDADFFLSEFLTGFIGVVIWLFLKVMFFFVFAYWGGYITLIILSPLFAYLSERTEEIISGKKYPFNPAQFMRDIVRGRFDFFTQLIYSNGLDDSSFHSRIYSCYWFVWRDSLFHYLRLLLRFFIY